MKYTAPKSALVHLVKQCAAVTPRKPLYPIAACLLMRAGPVQGVGGDTVTMSATDTAIAISGRIDSAHVLRLGAVAVDAKELLVRLEKMPEGQVTLAADETKLTITAPGSRRRFTVPVQSADDFPAMPDVAIETAQISPDVLERVIDGAAYAMADDATREHLSCLLIEWTPERIRAVATDGHRLATVEREAKEPWAPPDGFRVCVPAHAVGVIRRLIDTATDDVGLALHDRLTVIVGTVAVSALCVAADRFPPWQRVIPDPTGQHELGVQRAAALDLLGAVSVAANRDKHGIVLAFAGDVMRAKAEGPEQGDAADEIVGTRAARHAGVGDVRDEVKIGVSARYLSEALKHTDADEVELRFNGELDPIAIRAPGYVGVVMPMRI